MRIERTIRTLPPQGREAVRAALADPARAPVVTRALQQANPHSALRRIALEDVAILSGHRLRRPVVFPTVAKPAAKLIDRIAQRLAGANPVKDTRSGRTTLKIMALSPTPQQHLGVWYRALAAEELGGPKASTVILKQLPLVETAPFMGDISRYIDKVGDWFERAWDRGYLKYALGAAAVIGVGSAVGWDNVWSGIKSVASTVGDGVKSVFEGIFGGGNGAGVPTEPTPPPIPVDKEFLQDRAIKAADAYIETGQQTATEPHIAEMFEHLTKAGYDQQSALALIQKLVGTAIEMRQREAAERGEKLEPGKPKVKAAAILPIAAGAVILMGLAKGRAG